MDTLPSEEGLNWIKKQGYHLMAGPPQRMEMRQIAINGYFDSICDVPFTSNFWLETVEPGWLVLGFVPWTIGVGLKEQLTHLDQSLERCPNIAEATWFLLNCLMSHSIIDDFGIRLRTSTYLDGEHRTFAAIHCIRTRAERRLITINEVSDMSDSAVGLMGAAKL